MNRDNGALAIVLHSHMPYVEGFDTWPFGEEWLWEATATSYLRLLPVLGGNSVTVAITPVLADQFEAMQGEAGDRFESFLSDTRAQVFLEEREAFERDGMHELVAEVNRGENDYKRALEDFRRLGRDLNSAFRALSDHVDLWGGPATHPVLPLLATHQGIDLQLRTGLRSHQRRFGTCSSGIWLPECAWHPRLIPDLLSVGVDRFCVDQTGHWGEGSGDHLSPIAIEGGLTALPVDWRMVRLVWSAEGYPGRPKYRDTFKRTRLDLAPWRIDGEVYSESEARTQARDDAREFVAAVQGRLAAHANQTGAGGLCTFAIDTELLGHWWYEGPWWLEAVFEAAEQSGLRLVTATEAIDGFPARPASCSPSSWGDGKNFSTWDAPGVAGMVWETRKAEIDLVLAARHGSTGTVPLARAARELLALQSSDWAFLKTTKTAADYPSRRFDGHLKNFREVFGRMAQSPGSGKLASQTVTAELASLAPDLALEALAPQTTYPAIP